MNRRRLLSLLASAPLAGCLGAPDADGGPPMPHRDYARCLPDHLRALAAHARAVREQWRASLAAGPEPLLERRGWVRETLWRLAGGKPEPTPLSLRTTGEVERPGYRLSRLVYESRPGFHVTANLYVPTGRRGPFPGVLFQCGHRPSGKGAAPYQRACQGLAARGHVVLVFDPAGQGERIDYPDPSEPSRSRLGSADAEHSLAGELLLLAGDTATGLLLWDAVRSLDVLAAHPDVDPARLASAGQSGGGTLTMLLAAVDERLAAAVVSCGNTENLAAAGFEPPGSIDDAEQNLLGSGPLGLDRWDLLLPLVPRPLLVLVSTEDPGTTYSPAYLADGRAEAVRLASVYAALGAPDALRWVESAEPHGLSPARRAEMERWLGRWLLADGDPGFAPEPAPEVEEATWAVPGGNVVRALGSKRPVDLARDRLAARRRDDPRIDPAVLVGARRKAAGPRLTEIGTKPSRGCAVTAVEVQSAPSVWVPAWLFEPHLRARSVVIALDAAGRDRNGEGAWPALARAGWAVCAADVRGVGATAEASFAWASLVLGESLLAQRVADILALVEALTRHPRLRGLPLTLAAQEGLALPALFAAALDPRLARVYLDGPLASYQSLLEVEDPAFPLAGIFPGVAAVADLPDLAARRSPRPLILAGPVDGAGQPLAPEVARALYQAAPGVTVVPSRGWSFAAIASVLRP